MQTIAIERVKKGDVFRFPGKKPVYIADGYCRTNRKYEAHKWDDISFFIYKKKGTFVEIDFDF